MIRVSAISPVVSGLAWDLTERVEGLSWSNVNPGGHERCSFTLKSAWGTGFPEIRRGNIIRVDDGGRELFTGRIDDHDPQLQDAEQVSVTVYGLGVRAKDNTMREIYVDRDLSRWQGASVARRIVVTTIWSLTDPQATFDTGGGSPSLLQSIQAPWSAAFAGASEAWYDAKGIPIRSLYFAWKTGPNTSAADANWQWIAGLVTSDNLAAGDFSGDQQPSGATGTGTLTATAANRIWAMLDFNYAAVASASNAQFDLFWTCLAVYGDHGLPKQGTESATSAKGFFGSQIVADVCSRLNAAGIQARAIDTSSFVIPQLAFTDDTTHEDIITAVSKFESVDWGVWGADEFFGEHADPLTGYLDWTAKDLTDITWSVLREQTDSCDLHTEMGSTFNQVAVTYTDPTGQAGRTVRTIGSAALAEAGVATRSTVLQAGTLTLAGAQQLGDAFLLLSNGQPVSRGTITMKGLIDHRTRGRVPAHHMRADGSNLYVPDAFPDREVLSLVTTPDRRSVFPIKRVTVDCGGETPEVTVELDQNNDLLSTLTARLELAAQLSLGA